ncbi:MAG: GNAT family N-acetyltransferase [Alphaproteobacteria bacterium]|nr:GNAT family N-acetyltransferase [Alphaproteobacteria bacterium]
MAEDRPSPEAANDERIECTITFLEMTAAPQLPPVATPALKMALLRANRPTVSFYRYLYDAVGKPWMWTDRKRLRDSELRPIIEDPSVEIFVLYVEGVPAGYAEIDRRRSPEINLAYFGLVPEFIGRKLGWYFLNWVVRYCWGLRPAPSRLTVNTNNLDHRRALSLYQTVGFVPYARRTVWIDSDPNPTPLTDLQP